MSTRQLGEIEKKKKGLPTEKNPETKPVGVKKMTDEIHHFGGSRTL
jgi:hypothetical protein